MKLSIFFTFPLVITAVSGCINWSSVYHFPGFFSNNSSLRLFLWLTQCLMHRVRSAFALQIFQSFPGRLNMMKQAGVQ